ncbi:MAG: indolepyruvate ferredoxin oxidoreductase family protein [Geminicoccaceae bacterium]|nr:indolepyruvate ferredoxin oxidoreductase family protein [Geminicoccaceae bacterium]
MALQPVSLEDRWTKERGAVLLSGIQALVRLPMLQRVRDRARGLRTAGFVSGYRGSPLGGLDQALWQARGHLERHDVRFQPGLNEDLAATAVWGTQQVGLFPGAKVDGVFAMWYGKGPGLDRSLDVLKHANYAGTAPRGGVLAVVGDDHAAKSSTLPHQSDHVFAAAMIPVLSPAGVQEILDFGLHGWAMSRFAGLWVGLKLVTDTVESTAVVQIDPERVRVRVPADFEMPEGGLSIRWPDPPLVQEARMQRHKAYAALAYARANELNRIVIDSPRPRLGIVTAGKSYLDVLQALDDLGIDARLAGEIGLRLYKVGMTWPLESEVTRHFAEGLEEILVVEEKRQHLEYQLKEQLYNWREDVRPRVIGKFDEKGEWALPQGGWLLPAASELTPAMIARVIAARIRRFFTSEAIEDRVRFLEQKERALARARLAVQRVPHYCSGCPHNRSTRVSEGSFALAGIGCHYMATWIYGESTRTFSQMGGEGVAWIGQAPFTDRPHVFANLGDGTWYHSGILAVRAAVAAGVSITYKILYNDAVAMTGGQPVDGPLSVPALVRQLLAEGVAEVVVASDEPEALAGLPAGVEVRPRDELESIQRRLAATPGVTALVYVQTCAAEKRRRRKRGRYPDPPRRVVVNEAVCEGCGDCSAKSNCVSVVPVETEFGTKRAIDQSACNKDFSCLEGFCPSFVTVEGGRLRRGRGLSADPPAVPDPQLPPLAAPWNILVAGVGGTGVVTIGQVVAMAAHLEGKGVTVLDMAGLAQKGGAVWSHLRIADRPERLYATRIAAGEAQLLLGCDPIVTASDETLSRARAGLSRAIVNAEVPVTGDFVRAAAAEARTGDAGRTADVLPPLASMLERIEDAVGPGAVELVEAGRLALRLLGDSIATNMLLLGFAFQRGLVPVSAAAIDRAIELNGAAVAMNRRAFALGRLAAHDPRAVEALAGPAVGPSDAHRLSTSLEELVTRRVAHLEAYQDRAWAERYRATVERVRTAERAVDPTSTALAEAVARGLHKVMAYKDEYEVARLHADPAFHRALEATFEGPFRLCFHLAPPLLAQVPPGKSEPEKKAYGPWMLHLFRLLARLKGLRGTPFDPFRWSADRKLERALIREYEELLKEILARLSPATLATAVELARFPLAVRGFGPVKERHLEVARRRKAELLAALRAGTAPPAPAGPRRTPVAVLAG